MARSISIDGLPTWLFQCLVAGLAVFLALWGVLAVYSAATGGFDISGRPVLLGSLTVVWIVLTVAWVRRAREWDAGGSMWDAIRREQYAGRFAEVGGLARDSWKRALPGDDEEP